MEKDDCWCPEKLDIISVQRCAGDTHIIPQVKQAMFSRSFGGEIPAAILFPSAALSASPCVHSPSTVGAEERTLLRSSPILRLQAPLTPNMHCNKKISTTTCSCAGRK